ncbi:hypothetical protein X755_15640 [Mesorhizobium sp. LNJC405B00]|nr:hypothetical protein X755_15640 [Mesorhizobium sp. LNJC405B00]
MNQQVACGSISGLGATSTYSVAMSSSGANEIVAAVSFV